MNLRNSAFVPALAALLLAPAALHADAINPPTAVQTSPAMTDQERRNLAFVLDWWREVIQGGHLDLSQKYQADDYIQHNPNVPTGRAAFVTLLPERRRREAGEPDPRDARSGARRERRERRFRVPDLRAGVAGSARRDEDLPSQFVRGAAPCERQGPGALGQLQTDGGAARRSETCAVRATRKPNGARQHWAPCRPMSSATCSSPRAR